MRRYLAVALALLLTTVALPPVPVEAAAAKRTFVYLNEDGFWIHAFEVSKSGKLSELNHSPFPTGASDIFDDPVDDSQSLAYLPGRNLLFAGTLDGIAVFNVGKDGALNPVDGPCGCVEVLQVAVVHSGAQTFVYGSARADNAVVGYKVNSNGKLSELPDSPFDIGGQPEGLAVTDKLLFVGDDDNDLLYSFQIKSDGALKKAPGSPVDLAGFGGEIETVYQNGRLLIYADDDEDDLLFGFSSDQGGRLTPLPGSPFGLTFNAADGLASNGGNLLFALDTDDIFVEALKVDSQGRLKSLGGPQDTGLNDIAVGALARKGRLLLVADEGGALSSFSVDPSSGTIASLDFKILRNHDDPESVINGIIVVER